MKMDKFVLLVALAMGVLKFVLLDCGELYAVMTIGIMLMPA